MASAQERPDASSSECQPLEICRNRACTRVPPDISSLKLDAHFASSFHQQQRQFDTIPTNRQASSVKRDSFVTKCDVRSANE